MMYMQYYIIYTDTNSIGPNDINNNNEYRVLYIIVRGGGGVLALEMGRGVPPACSKPDPVAIRFMAKKTLSQFLN